MFDIDRRVLVIAEIGNNHEGDFERAREMVREAAQCGVHAVKLQMFRTEHYVSAMDEDRFAQLKRFELTYDHFAELADLAHSLGLLFVCTPFDLASAELLAGLVDAFKVASGDIDFYPLVRKMAESDRPMIMSSGVSDVERIRRAVASVEDVRGSRAEPGLALLHCVSSYPAAPDDLNLNAIRYLRDAFDYPIGYSDHSIGVEAAVVAVALGARIVEKHFTLEGIKSEFRDHQLSATPTEMREIVNRITTASLMLGPGGKRIEAGERGNVGALQRSVVAARDLDAGHVLERDDLTWVRPGGGLPPGEEVVLLGSRLLRAVRLGERVLVSDVER